MRQILWALGVILIALTPASLSGTATTPVDLLVKGGTVVTMDRERRVLERGAVAIQGDRIVGVFAASEPLPEAKKTIDASGSLVIPGLVNTHGHAAMTLLRGLADDLKLLEWLEDHIFPAEGKNVSPEFVYWGTLLGCVEMVRGGTTTFTDMYYYEEEAARAVEIAGMRGVLGQVIIGFPAPDYKTPEDALAGAQRFLERYRNHPLVIPSVAPHALYTTPMEIVKRSHDLAHRYDVPFQIHAVEAREENDRVIEKLGKRTIAALDDAGVLTSRTILHHAIWLSDEDIRQIARSGAGISHNPESNLKLAAGLARVPELIAAGIPVGLGTDGAASNNNLDLFEEMDTAAKVHKLFHKDPTVLPANLVFEMATLGGAKVLGLSDRIGSLEPGKLADVVLVDVERPELTPLYDVYSHLVYAIKAAHVDTVIINGRIVLQGRKMLTVDTAEVLLEANILKERVLKSLADENP